MPRAAALVGLVLVPFGCLRTGGPAPAVEPSEPVPPPPAAEQPRLATMPPPDDLPREDPRFPIAEWQMRQARKNEGESRARRPPLASTAQEIGDCSGLSAEARVSCPLDSYGPVRAIERIPGGVRLRYGPRSSEAFARLQKMLACQAGLARVHPEAPPFCPFFDARTIKRLRRTGGGAVVDLLAPSPEEASVLRQRVEVAFGSGGKLE